VVRPRGAGPACVLLSALIGLALTTAGPAAAELYRWVDGAGDVHYTAERTSIPEPFRGGAVPLTHPSARSGPAPPADEPPPAAVAAGPLVVEARVNGVVLRLLVDTGADRTMLSPAAVERAGYGAEPGVPVQILGVTGSASASLIVVPLLEVAGQRVGPLGVVVHAPPLRDVDGLLGRDVLNAFTLTVDGRSGRAVLKGR
jgi:aspartyl protease/uncharacterized protein DUF4124